MVELIALILRLLALLIVARAILSFVIPMTGGRPHPILVSVISLVNQITEPVLSPIRRVLPTIGMIDLSPMVAIIVLELIRAVLLGGL